MNFLREFRQLILLVLLALFYFVSTYFAVAALASRYALQARLIAAMVAIGLYLFLFLIGRDEEGLPLGLLILLPIICIAAGGIWWGLRLLGLWEDFR